MYDSLTRSEQPSGANSGPSGELEIRRYHGRVMLRQLRDVLLEAGFLPAPLATMDPDFLAEGFEGQEPGAMVAYVKNRPVAYMTYSLRPIDFRLAFGPVYIGHFRYRQLRLYGYAGGDEASHQTILDRFFDRLTNDTSWDVVQIFSLPFDNQLCAYISRNRATLNPKYSVVETIEDTFQVAIDRDFESFLKNRFTKKTRYNLKREVRLLEETAEGDLIARVYQSPDDTGAFLRDAERIAQRSYKWRREISPLGDIPYFARKLSYLAAHDRWRGYILFIRGVPAAFFYATIRWGELYIELVGHDLEFTRLNPGKVLLYRVFEDLHEWRGVSQLNFGTGTREYREIFATSTRRTLDAAVYRREPYPQLLRFLAKTEASAFHAFDRLIRPWKPYLKRRLRHAMRMLVVGALPYMREEILELAA